MRWIPFIILTYVVMLLQTTLVRVLMLNTASLGPIGPDLAAVVAVFLAFRVRQATDVVLCAWILGTAIDLTTAGGAGSGTVVGPMGITYSLTAWLIYLVREALFREKIITQALATMAFVLIAHGLWLILQRLLSGRSGGQSLWWPLLQAVGVAACTAIVAPLGQIVLERCRSWFIVASVGRAMRGQR